MGAAAALGIATVDGAYAALAVVAGATLAALLAPVADALRIASGVVLLVIAALTLAHALRGNGVVREAAPMRPAAAYALFLGITAVNPTTVVYFAAIVLGNQDLVSTAAEGVAFVLAAFVASASWQLALAGGGAPARPGRHRPARPPHHRRGVRPGHRRAGRPYDDVVTLPDGVTLRTAVVADAERRGPAAPGLLARGLRADHRPDGARASTCADEAGWAARWQAQIEAGFAPLLAVDAAGPRSGSRGAGTSRDEDVAGHPGAVRPLRPGGLARHRHRRRPPRRRGRRGPGVLVGAGGQRPGPTRSTGARASNPTVPAKRYEPLSAWEIRMARR